MDKYDYGKLCNRWKRWSTKIESKPMSVVQGNQKKIRFQPVPSNNQLSTEYVWSNDFICLKHGSPIFRKHGSIWEWKVISKHLSTDIFVGRLIELSTTCQAIRFHSLRKLLYWKEVITSRYHMTRYISKNVYASLHIRNATLFWKKISYDIGRIFTSKVSWNVTVERFE